MTTRETSGNGERAGLQPVPVVNIARGRLGGNGWEHAIGARTRRKRRFSMWLMFFGVWMDFGWVHLGICPVGGLIKCQ
jgi:hypothetical protein